MAARSSTSLSNMVGMSVTKVSSADDRISVAIRRRLTCVLRSASSLADVAPTPKTMPAVVGALIRPTSSGILSLSASVHCLNRGAQPSAISSRFIPKNLESLKASLTSFFHVFWLFCNLESSCKSVNVFRPIVSGKLLERKAGPMTLVEMVPAADSTRSDSTNILGRLGTIDARIATTSSGPSEPVVLRRPPSAF